MFNPPVKQSDFETPLGVRQLPFMMTLSFIAALHKYMLQRTNNQA